METDNQKIRELLERFFYSKLKIDDLIFEFVHSELKKADEEGRLVYDPEFGWCIESSPFWELKFEEKSLDVIRPTLQDMVMKNQHNQITNKLRDSL